MEPESYARESFVAGLKNSQVLAPLCYQGTMDSTLFNFWLANFLVPNINEEDTIVMDNAAFHKSEDTRKIIKTANCHLVFLPPCGLSQRRQYLRWLDGINPSIKYGAWMCFGGEVARE